MEQLIDFHAPEVQAVLDTLLKDRSTGKNIIWGTDPPEELQTVMYEPVTDRSQITTQQLRLTHYEVVLPRMMKQTDTQQQRTRKKGEVFSPAWVCNKMNNALDVDWFGTLGAEESTGQFSVELPQGWQTVETPVQFPACGGKTPAWVQYVQSRRLEVTCGEAPFLASRYDAATGEMIPVARRIGILDRKLRVGEPCPRLCRAGELSRLSERYVRPDSRLAPSLRHRGFYRRRDLEYAGRPQKQL